MATMNLRGMGESSGNTLGNAVSIVYGARPNPSLR
jgi:hypothetical protein